MQHLSKEQLVAAADVAFRELTVCCSTLQKEIFFFNPGGKWSIAENIQHLILSTRTTNIAYSIPVFLLRCIAGKPNRPSRPYDTLLAKYNLQLTNGGKASSRFIPKPLNPGDDKEILIKEWRLTTERFIFLVNKNMSEKKLDQYIIPHPLLGKITLRELGYFTIFHTLHHLQSIHSIIKLNSSLEIV